MLSVCDVSAPHYVVRVRHVKLLIVNGNGAEKEMMLHVVNCKCELIAVASLIDYAKNSPANGATPSVSSSLNCP